MATTIAGSICIASNAGATVQERLMDMLHRERGRSELRWNGTCQASSRMESCREHSDKSGERASSSQLAPRREVGGAVGGAG